MDDTMPMDTTIATANALHRMLLQSLLATRSGPIDRSASATRPVPPADAGETLPMLYRSEAFAEDLLDAEPLPPR